MLESCRSSTKYVLLLQTEHENVILSVEITDNLDTCRQYMFVSLGFYVVASVWTPPVENSWIRPSKRLLYVENIRGRFRNTCTSIVT